MKILVTGHLGYIGAELTPYLIDRGHDVVGLDTDFFAGCDFVEKPYRVANLGIDVRDVEPPHLAGFDAVVHLAALSNDPLSNLNPRLTHDINQRASIRLAKAAKAAGVSRFVFSSSCSIYGKGPGDDILDENARFHPVTPYGESKVEVERQLSKLADSCFSPVYLRNATAYGVSRRLRADLVVNNLIGYAVTSGRVLLHSDGTPWRPLVHVLDIAQAFATVLTVPRRVIHDQAFNVGRVGENYRIRDVADLVSQAIPGCSVEHADRAAPDIRDYRVDFTKITRELPTYTPQWSLQRGIEQLCAAYEDGGMTAERFESSKYFRLRTVARLLDRGELDDDLRWTQRGRRAS